VATSMVWLVVAISLALPSVLLLTLDNLRPLAPDLGHPAQISVLLDGQLDLAQAESLQRQIAAWATVEDVVLVGRDEALATFGEQTGLSGLLKSLDRNPLPYTLLVSPRAPPAGDALSQLIEDLNALPSVDRALADNQWMARLNQILVAGERWVLALGGAMALGAILALANTVYLAIAARREEILVVSLIGGSPAFIRRPFLYTGLYFGAGGGLLAGVMLWALTLWVAGPINALFLLYDSPGQLYGPGWRYPLVLIGLGAGLGWLASWIASARYFSRMEAH
jgi:cell division transport system permease protein